MIIFAKTVSVAGAKTKYDPRYVEQARKLARMGATDEETADFFNVTRKTIDNWRHDYKEFHDAMMEGKAEADAKVVRSLYERAIGYEHPEDKIFQHEGEPLIVPTTKRYPPDTTAAIFWLKNRQPDNWRDKQEFEGSLNHNIIEGIDYVVPDKDGANEDKTEPDIPATPGL